MSTVQRVILIAVLELLLYTTAIALFPIWGSIFVIILLLISFGVMRSVSNDLYYVRWMLQRAGAPKWLIYAWKPIGGFRD